MLPVFLHPSGDQDTNFSLERADGVGCAESEFYSLSLAAYECLERTTFLKSTNYLVRLRNLQGVVPSDWS